jgi:hypothetical protein
MAKARRCDRCGNFFGINDDFTYVYWSDSIEGRISDKDRHEGDLCFECAKEFKDWLKKIVENEDKEAKKYV